MIADLGEFQLYYEQINWKEDGPVILFLHEGLGSISLWKDFPQKLCNLTGLPGLMYDRQGHGKSSPLTEERDETYLEKYALIELPAFIEAIQLNRPLILFGHSDGGSISLIFSSRFPEKVEKIITEAAHIFVEDKTWEGIKPVIEAFDRKEGFYHALQKHHGDKVENTFYAWAKTWKKKKENQWNVGHYLSEVKAEALLIQGKQDEYATDEHLIHIQQGLPGNSIGLFLDQCTHHPHSEQETQVLGAVQTFLNPQA